MLRRPRRRDQGGVSAGDAVATNGGETRAVGAGEQGPAAYGAGHRFVRSKEPPRSSVSPLAPRRRERRPSPGGGHQPGPEPGQRLVHRQQLQQAAAGVLQERQVQALAGLHRRLWPERSGLHVHVHQELPERSVSAPRALHAPQAQLPRERRRSPGVTRGAPHDTLQGRAVDARRRRGHHAGALRRGRGKKTVQLARRRRPEPRVRSLPVPVPDLVQG
mmetsp:Transcript_15500/g.60675  ORF Transcript_15500/g.60675 Transcript_15500/m.60675 type:complete len:218 (-) Transcript_15500:523-1176(-)